MTWLNTVVHPPILYHLTWQHIVSTILFTHSTHSRALSCTLQHPPTTTITPSNTVTPSNTSHPLLISHPSHPLIHHINNCRSVPSYDAVWGSNHAYGGASMTVGKDGESGVLQHVLDVFSAYTHGGIDERMETSMRKDGGVDVGISSSTSSSSSSSSSSSGGNNGSTSSDHQLSSSRASSLNTKRSTHHVSPCSDCVTVIHRVGERFRQQQRTNNGHSPTTSPSSSSSSPTSSSSSLSAPFSSSSVNPSLMNATLWIEIDCGHFYRSRHSWPTCR